MSIVLVDNTSTLALFQAAVVKARRMAVLKGVEIIDDRERGCCSPAEADVEQMLDYVDSLKCIIPEGAVVGGEQACFTVVIDGGKDIVVASLEIEGSAYPNFSMTPGANFTGAEVAQAIANHINSFFPQSYVYTSTVVGDALTICGTKFEVNNGDEVFFNISKSNGPSQPVSGNLAGGTAGVIQGENPISNNDLQIILNRVCKLYKK